MRNLETGKEKYMVERISKSKAVRSAGWEVVDDAPLIGMKDKVDEIPTGNGLGEAEDIVETPEEITEPKPKAKSIKPIAKKPAAKKKTTTQK